MRKAFLIATAIALALTLGGGAAWAKGSGESSSGQAAKGYDWGDTGGLKLPLVTKPTTLKYYVQEHPSTPFKKDWVIWKNLSEATGVTFDFVVVGADTFEQKMRLLYSTNDLPDIVATRLFLANEFGSQGGIENILANLDKMPNFAKALKTYPDAKAMITTLDGKAYYFPCLGSAKYLLNYLYRSDVFKKMGITPPEYTDDFEAALKKLREAYPDVYPFTSRRGITDQFSFFATIAPQWKTGQNMYLDAATDTYKYGPIEDNYKRMLQYFNKLYNEKLLDPEWATLATKQWEDKLINGRCFVTLDYIYRIETMLPAARAVNKEWTLDGLMPITEKGFGEPKLWVRNSSSDTDGFLVPANSKNKDLALRVIDFMYSPAGAYLTNFGKVGDTAVRGADGKYAFAPQVKCAANPSGTNAFDAFYGFTTLSSYTVFTPDMMSAQYTSREFFDCWNRYEAKNVGFIKPPLKYSETQRSQIAEIETALNDFCNAQTASFVVKGNFQDWDQFVAKARTYKIDKLVDLYNQVYKQSK